MKEVDEPQSESLFTRNLVIPMTHLIQVDALVHRGKHSSEKAAHECQISLVHGFKHWDELSLVGVDVGGILLVDKLGRFFLDGKLYDPLEFFSPDLFALDIQEVLDVLDGAFETDKAALKSLKAVAEFSETSLSSLYLDSFGVELGLLFVCLGLGLFIENELLVQDLGQLTA